MADNMFNPFSYRVELPVIFVVGSRKTPLDTPLDILCDNVGAGLVRAIAHGPSGVEVGVVLERLLVPHALVLEPMLEINWCIGAVCAMYSVLCSTSRLHVNRASNIVGRQSVFNLLLEAPRVTDFRRLQW